MKLLCAVSLALGLVAAGSCKPGGPPQKKIKNLVVFGDSYTEEGRLSYFGEHKKAPPPGYVFPASNSTASGGKVWARMAAEKLGAKLYNYAVGGAVCSNKLTPRTWDSIDAPFPAVLEYELPAFEADKKFLKLNLAETVFAIWIGTNDVGPNALLTSGQLPNVGLTNVTNCVLEAVQGMKKLGARKIVVLNMAPLELAPMYADEAHGGYVEDDVFWGDKSKYTNLTAVAEEMRELTWNGNEILKYKIPAETARWKDTTVGALDAHSMLWDAYHTPAKFLTGKAPYNVTGWTNHCSLDWQCKQFQPERKDSFFWFDELHPSEAAERVVANEFVKLLTGKTSYGQWY